MPQNHSGEGKEARYYLYNMNSFIYSCNEILLITQCVPGLGPGATDTKAVRHQGPGGTVKVYLGRLTQIPVILNQG